MNQLPDQTEIWDKKHAAQEHGVLRGIPSPFARIAVNYFSEKSEILEIGCGVGRDAEFFASQGHKIIATDSSNVVIHQNKAQSSQENVTFEVLDIRRPLPYEPKYFDVVYANLSLHYFYDKQTREVFRAIAQVLKPGGIFAFTCKSKDEQRTKDAKEVESSLFVDSKGHALRLFSTDYAKDLLDGKYRILHLDDIEEEYVGRFSNIVRCVASKSP